MLLYVKLFCVVCLLVLALEMFLTSICVESATDKTCVCCRHLQRMGVGMFLAAVAFVIAGVLQLQIEVVMRVCVHVSE